MPVYTCTATRGTLTHESKAPLAAEITRIHAAVNHVPPAYVDVIFAEPSSEDVFVGGVPGMPLIITAGPDGGIRRRTRRDWRWSCPQRPYASRELRRVTSRW
jgi:phenylpyruvate tautomerase PptA (4-oxalocrotonate tautomerase family)